MFFLIFIKLHLITIPVIGLPVEVRGLDAAVVCDVLTADCVLNDVPGFCGAAVDSISVSKGSSTLHAKIKFKYIFEIILLSFVTENYFLRKAFKKFQMQFLLFGA